MPENIIPESHKDIVTEQMNAVFDRTVNTENAVIDTMLSKGGSKEDLTKDIDRELENFREKLKNIADGYGVKDASVYEKEINDRISVLRNDALDIIDPERDLPEKDTDDLRDERLGEEIKHYREVLEQIPAVDKATLEEEYKKIFFEDVMDASQPVSRGERAGAFTAALNELAEENDTIAAARDTTVKNVDRIFAYDRILDQKAAPELKDYCELKGMDRNAAETFISENYQDRLCIVEKADIETGIYSDIATGRDPAERIKLLTDAQVRTNPADDWLLEMAKSDHERKDIRAVRAASVVLASESAVRSVGDFRNRYGDMADRMKKPINLSEKIALDIKEEAEKTDIYVLKNFEKDQLGTYLNRDADNNIRTPLEKEVLMEGNMAKVEAYTREYASYIDRNSDPAELMTRADNAERLREYIIRDDPVDISDRLAAVRRNLQDIMYEAMNHGDEETMRKADSMIGEIDRTMPVIPSVTVQTMDMKALENKADISAQLGKVYASIPGDEIHKLTEMSRALYAVKEDDRFIPAYRTDRAYRNRDAYISAIEQELERERTKAKEEMSREAYTRYLIRSEQKTSEEYLLEQQRQAEQAEEEKKKEEEERKEAERRAEEGPDMEEKLEDAAMTAAVVSVSDVLIDERIENARKSSKEFNDNLRAKNEEKEKDGHYASRDESDGHDR